MKEDATAAALDVSPVHCVRCLTFASAVSCSRIERESQSTADQQYPEFGHVARDSTDFDTGCI